MSAYQTILLVLHVIGAIVGFGPTLTFGILGPLAGKHRGPGGVAIMEGMLAIQKRLVLPVALVVQPVTGVLLIFAREWDDGFLGHTWLWLSIVLYAINLSLSVGVSRPALVRLHALATAGGGPPPPETVSEMQAIAARNKAIGAFLGVSLLVIGTLMVWKPGT